MRLRTPADIFGVDLFSCTVYNHAVHRVEIRLGLGGESMLHENELRRFASVASGGRLVHAYCIEGADGVGKLDFALECARAVLCTGEIAPCGECDSCIKAAGGNHPDISVIVPSDSRKFISIEQLRELRRDASVVPNEGERKVYIIPNAHTLPARSQNALLKLLEEPPAAVVFFLLTSRRETLLPTLRSRMELISLPTVSAARILNELRKLYPRLSEPELVSASERSGGRIGRARGLLEKSGIKLREDALLVLNSLLMPASRKYEFISAVNLATTGKSDVAALIFNELSFAFSDLIEAVCGKKTEFCFFDAGQQREYLRIYPLEKLVRCARITAETADRLYDNPNMNALMAWYADAIWAAAGRS